MAWVGGRRGPTPARRARGRAHRLIPEAARVHLLPVGPRAPSPGLARGRQGPIPRRNPRGLEPHLVSAVTEALPMDGTGVQPPGLAREPPGPRRPPGCPGALAPGSAQRLQESRTPPGGPGPHSPSRPGGHCVPTHRGMDLGRATWLGPVAAGALSPAKQLPEPCLLPGRQGAPIPPAHFGCCLGHAHRQGSPGPHPQAQISGCGIGGNPTAWGAWSPAT